MNPEATPGLRADITALAAFAEQSMGESHGEDDEQDTQSNTGDAGHGAPAGDKIGKDKTIHKFCRQGLRASTRPGIRQRAR